MIAWIALVVAVFALAFVAIHALIPDSVHGGRAHDTSGAGAWILSTFPSLASNLPSAPAPASTPALSAVSRPVPMVGGYRSIRTSPLPFVGTAPDGSAFF